MTSTSFSPSKEMAADAAVAQAQGVAPLAQIAVDNQATVMAVLASYLAPYMRQYGHSALVAAIGPAVVAVAAYYGMPISADTAATLCVALFVGGSYLWQTISIWLGKRNAPIQPAAK